MSEVLGTKINHLPSRTNPFGLLFSSWLKEQGYSEQLRELVEDGLVSKTIFPELPPRSEYAITALGKTLIPIIDAMLDWGNKNKELFERKYGK